MAGPHRCAEANLVVVRDLAILHDGASLAADVDVAVSFLYVVALGLDVVTRAQLVAASYVPGRLLPSQYLRHARACEQRATLRVEERLDVEFPSVRAALRRIARALGGKIVVDAVGAPASGGVSLGHTPGCGELGCLSPQGAPREEAHGHADRARGGAGGGHGGGAPPLHGRRQLRRQLEGGHDHREQAQEGMREARGRGLAELGRALKSKNTSSASTSSPST